MLLDTQKIPGGQGKTIAFIYYKSTQGVNHDFAKTEKQYLRRKRALEKDGFTVKLL